MILKISWDQIIGTPNRTRVQQSNENGDPHEFQGTVSKDDSTNKRFNFFRKNFSPVVIL